MNENSQTLPALRIVGDTDTGHLKGAMVMLIDDETTTLEVLQTYLEDAGYCRFVPVSESRTAMDLMARTRPDVVLLDIMMPEVNGFEILTAMRADPKFRQTPVIVLTSSTDSPTKLKALELGATDFLSKPVDASELAMRLRNILNAKAYLDRVAHFDTLTGVHNRQMFLDHVDRALRHEGTGAVLHIGIDRFKQVNDALGPALGDELLKEAAGRFKACLRRNDAVARVDREVPSVSRLGGDEFAVLLTQVNRTENTMMVARRLIDAMREPFRLAGRECYATCSIGISVFPADGLNRETLLQNAGAALLSAKKRGGNAYAFHAGDMDDRSRRYLDLYSDLRKAIDRNEFQLYYQPKFETATRRLTGAEALLRWRHPDRGMVNPMEFIPLAEETGLIVPIGSWVFAEACRQIAAWRRGGLLPVKVAVNVSWRQLAEADYLQCVRAALGQTGIEPRMVQIELTESMLLERADETLPLLHKLREMGLKLSIDDFGTGYSSLSVLGQLPVDELKIDRSFVSHIDKDASGRGSVIARAMIALAHNFGLAVVAEGVETESQWTFLRDHGCDQSQGFLLGKPVPVTDFNSLLEKDVRRAANAA